jgi:hypothetical protein
VRKLILIIGTVAALSGCASDGSVNWDALGAISLGIGAAALGAAEVYENVVSPPPSVVQGAGPTRGRSGVSAREGVGGERRGTSSSGPEGDKC